MRLLPTSLVPTFTLALTSLASSGCSTETAGVAGGGAAAIGLGLGLYQVLRSRSQQPTALPRGVSLPTEPVGESREVSEIRNLQDRTRFISPGLIHIDLRDFARDFEGDDLTFRIGRRGAQGFQMDQGQPLLGVSDIRVSRDHAEVRVKWIDGRPGKFWVFDRSANGTQIMTLGFALRSSEYFPISDRPSVRLFVGAHEVELQLQDPSKIPVRTAVIPAARVAPPRRIPIIPVSSVPVLPSSLSAEGSGLKRVVEPKPTLDPERVRLWVETVLMDKAVYVKPVPDGVAVEIRSKTPGHSNFLRLNFPKSTTEAAIRCVCDYLNKHCHLFRSSGIPTVDLSLSWQENGGDPLGRIYFVGTDPKKTVAKHPGDRVIGSLTEEDLKNRNGLPGVSMSFSFDPEPSAQVVRMIEQLKDAFRRVREAIEHSGAPWEAIDPIVGIFDPR